MEKNAHKELLHQIADEDMQVCVLHKTKAFNQWTWRHSSHHPITDKGMCMSNVKQLLCQKEQDRMVSRLKHQLAKKMM